MMSTAAGTLGRLSALLVIAHLAPAVCAAAASQESDQGLARTPPTKSPSLGELLGERARIFLADPPLFERPGAPTDSSRLARLLEDAHLRLEAFERSGDNALALGFSYALAKELGRPDEPGEPSYALLAEGHMALERSANPEDFLATRLRARWSGLRTFGASEARLDRARSLDDPRDEELATLDQARAPELDARLAGGESAAAFQHDPAFLDLERRYTESLLSTLPAELAWGFDLHAGLESTQDFSSRQVVLGAALEGRFVSWDPRAGLSRWNLFDLPAAALRWLAGGAFGLSGRAYPTVVAGLDVVDASRDETRGALTDTKSFLRAGLELGVRSELMELGNGMLHLSTTWRINREVDAPGAVREAGTDDHGHLRVELELPQGCSLLFSAGTLPLDERYDSTFTLGYRLRF